MRHRTRIACTAALLLTLTTAPAATAADAGTTHVDGQLPSGATYMMDVPTTWNGTVLLFSHGYNAGPANPAQDAPDAPTKALLLQQGYALIGSSYASTGWAVTDAVPDQMATLTAFTDRFGQASRTIAWGRSYGGLVTTAIAERHPEEIDGSLSMCGLVHGGVANWNNTLDPVFALKTLLGSDVPLVNLPTQQAATDAANTSPPRSTPPSPRPRAGPVSPSPRPCTTSRSGTRPPRPAPPRTTGKPSRPTSTTPSRAC
ncbi:pimeloyl-ACP methyl ester carboxylesterase [Streptomyces canus]|nr:pimeloyl-ACP methyl ester carboxylesterase [Streptomyces canus]